VLQSIFQCCYGSLLISLLVLCNPAQAEEVPEANKVPPPQYSIQITDPMANQTLQNTTPDLPVTVSVTPVLVEGDMVQIYLDGQPVGNPSSSTTITIPKVLRGSHTIQAKVIQPKGKGAASDVITIDQQSAPAQ
jgi:hypothetical protein